MIYFNVELILVIAKLSNQKQNSPLTKIAKTYQDIFVASFLYLNLSCLPPASLSVAKRLPVFEDLKK